ncbi:MAG: RecX family transcriptional regulator [Parachlamydiaceae bacterium]
MDDETEEYRRAKHSALRRLSMQAMLSNQLAIFLQKRQFTQEVIERVIKDLTTLELLNDTEWSASFVRSQSRRKLGPRAIAQKLARKGVRGESLEKAIEGSWDASEQKAMIHQLLQTRFSKRDLSDPKERKKVAASLVRRGFDLSLIFRCLSCKNDDFDEV